MEFVWSRDLILCVIFTNIQNLSQIPQSCAKLWLFFQNPRWRLRNDNFGQDFYYTCHSAPAYQI